MLGIIDRFEENYAVIELENKQVINMEKNKIPSEAREGYVINIDKTVTINLKETENRMKHIESNTEDIWN